MSLNCGNGVLSSPGPVDGPIYTPRNRQPRRVNSMPARKNKFKLRVNTGLSSGRSTSQSPRRKFTFDSFDITTSSRYYTSRPNTPTQEQLQLCDSPSRKTEQFWDENKDILDDLDDFSISGRACSYVEPVTPDSDSSTPPTPKNGFAIPRSKGFYGLGSKALEDDGYDTDDMLD